MGSRPPNAYGARERSGSMFIEGRTADGMAIGRRRKGMMSVRPASRGSPGTSSSGGRWSSVIPSVRELWCVKGWHGRGMRMGLPGSTSSSPRMLPRWVTRVFCMPRDSDPHRRELKGMLSKVALVAALAVFAPAIAGVAAVHPHIFAPGVISTEAPDIAPAFLDGGRTLFFSRREEGRWSVLRTDRRGESWSMPVLASFSGSWNDLEAAAAPSGRYLIFASDRPRAGDKTRLTAHYYGQDQVGGSLWRVGLTGTATGMLR